MNLRYLSIMKYLSNTGFPGQAGEMTELFQECFIFIGAAQKCSDAEARKNRIARRILTYVERCGLRRNTADERFLTAHLLNLCVITL